MQISFRIYAKSAFSLTTCYYRDNVQVPSYQRYITSYGPRKITITQDLFSATTVTRTFTVHHTKNAMYTIMIKKGP